MGTDSIQSQKARRGWHAPLVRMKDIGDIFISDWESQDGREFQDTSISPISCDTKDDQMHCLSDITYVCKPQTSHTGPMSYVLCLSTMESEAPLKLFLAEDGAEDEKESIGKKCWWTIPGLGFIIIIVKNLIAALSDILVKSMSSLHPVSLIFLRSVMMLSLITPVSIARDRPPFPQGQGIQEYRIAKMLGPRYPD